MPVTPPRLDDLDYSTIEKMLRGRIPLVAPEWTDHNDSDPGIAMLQLFAFLAEQVGYRINRVPEKTYVEFMKLVGVRLRPTVAARTRMAFVLAKPERADGVFLPRGSRITAAAGKGKPPDFETDAGLDVLPAQVAALITTRNGLTDINATGETLPIGGDARAWARERFSIAWDGKSPKLKDLPTQPVPLFFKPEEATHKTLYVALAFNPAPTAGFLGARATLHLQIDADEQPEPQLSVQAGDVAVEIVNAVPDGPPAVEYAYYRPAALGGSTGSWEPLQVIGDGTGGWQQSGAIRFEVPARMGPIPQGSWVDYATDRPHPLVGALKTPVEGTPSDVPVSGWLRVRFAVAKKVAVRSLSFNTVEAVNLTSVSGERLGPGDGRPGQAFALANPNAEADGLSVISRDDTQPEPILAWRAVPDFDSALPDEPVYVLDAEAGMLLFGDGVRGRPPRVSETMIADFYRHGGGVDGNVATGTVSKPVGLPPALSAAVNIVPARGGRSAETLDDAKQRTPRAFRMRGRAVTAADFEDSAQAAPGVRIARAAAVPLHRPYPEGHRIGGQFAPGIDLGSDAPGTVTVVVVPEAEGAYPMPTGTELTAVANYLDTVRLLTTEVHVTTPQYVRLYDFQVAVRAEPGYSETLLREAIGDHLSRRIHVLTGGPDGKGYPFGGVLHHADLVAEIFAVTGVARMIELSCMVDGRTPAAADHPLSWRLERQVPRHLTNCVRTAADILSIDLLTDEVPFIDASSLSVRIVAE